MSIEKISPDVAHNFFSRIAVVADQPEGILHGSRAQLRTNTLDYRRTSIRLEDKTFGMYRRCPSQVNQLRYKFRRWRFFGGPTKRSEYLYTRDGLPSCMCITKVARSWVRGRASMAIRRQSSGSAVAWDLLAAGRWGGDKKAPGRVSESAGTKLCKEVLWGVR